MFMFWFYLDSLTDSKYNLFDYVDKLV